MADLFISYARTDRDRVEVLAAALEGAGYSLWWDRRVRGGDDFATEIERELKAASAVIVVWSASGAKSNWVRDEASLAADQGSLVALSLDGSDPPIGFRQYHCLDLSSWDGDPHAPAFVEVLRAVDARRTQTDGLTTAAHAEKRAEKRADKRAEKPVSSTQAARTKPAPDKWKVGLVSLTIAAVAIAIFYFAMRSPDDMSNSGSAKVPASSRAIADKSIAVLPFVAMSSGEEDGFMADGLSEELLNVLAGNDQLKVASRTSAFAFRDTDRGVQEIGEQLGVAYVLEGSVRRAGDRLRITAQLIEVDSGFHLWSESYDRESADVIEIQDDIARRVSLALQSAMAGDDGVPLVEVGTRNGAAYQLNLQGRALLNQRGLGVAKAIYRFEEAVALDPNYARAYAGLSAAHLVSSNYLRTPTAISHQRAADNARKAIALDNTLAEPVAVLAALEVEKNQWNEAGALFERAGELDPTDVVTLQWSGEMLLYLGYIEAAKAKLLRALEIEPESAVLNLIAGNIYQTEDNLEAAEYYFRLAQRYGMVHAILNAGLVELQKGDAAAAALDFARNMEALQFLASEDVADMARFLESIVAGEIVVDGNIERFPALAADEDFRAVMYLYAGQGDAALRLIEADTDRDKDTFFKIWTSIVPGMRQEPYFQEFAENTGLLAYWREHGWPDKCQPVAAASAAQAFVCD